MLENRRSQTATALILITPFLIVYGALFVYPTLKMIGMTFTDAPLIGAGEWVGLKNYYRLFSDRLFKVAFWNTLYFVLLTVVPSTLLGLVIALGVNRLKGWWQSAVLAAFFLPYILPVSVVYRIWNWLLDSQFGLFQYPIAYFAGQNIPIFRTLPLFMPTVAWVTIWWLIGFNVLLFIAGLRNISSEIYEASELDGATRWQQFTPHHLAADLADHGAGRDDPAYSATEDFRSDLPVFHRRPRRRDLGHGAADLPGGFPEEPGRLWRDGGACAVCHHRHCFSAAISAAARAG